jgi:hypothetical protein
MEIMTKSLELAKSYRVPQHSCEYEPALNQAAIRKSSVIEQEALAKFQGRSEQGLTLETFP